MNKVLLLSFILSVSLVLGTNKFLLKEKEILLPNNVDDVYGTGVQQELVKMN